MEKVTLESMVTQSCYDEITKKLKEKVGSHAFYYIFPAVKKALEEGSREAREDIINSWLNLDTCRVCTQCGAIMQEGWYLNMNGYACSDECAAKSEDITKEQFDKWQIYKDDIIEYLKDEGEGRKIEDLSKEECQEIIKEYCQNLDYYYTEWY